MSAYLLFKNYFFPLFFQHLLVTRWFWQFFELWEYTWTISSRLICITFHKYIFFISYGNEYFEIISLVSGHHLVWVSCNVSARAMRNYHVLGHQYMYACICVCVCAEFCVSVHWSQSGKYAVAAPELHYPKEKWNSNLYQQNCS